MNHRIVAGSVVLSGMLMLAGCYTQMMTPQEFLQSRRSTPASAPSASDNSFALNYNRSCVSCHSIGELNERAEELEYYHIRSVHNGYLLSDRSWITGPAVAAPIYIPTSNPYFPGNPSTGTAWWVTGGGSGNGTQSRPRTDTPTRDGSVVRDRPGTTATAPAPGTTTTPTPAGTGTAVSTTPAPPAAPVNSDGSRARSGTGTVDANGRTRSDGSTRDGSEERPR